MDKTEVDHALMDVFGEPDAFTGAGNRWYVLRSAQQAKLAERLSQTAINIFWDMAQRKIPEGGEDSHAWLIMVKDGRADVAMAARIEGRESLHDNVADCHITGWRNKMALPEHEADVVDVCRAMGLTYAPNHMGHPLRPEGDAPSP